MMKLESWKFMGSQSEIIQISIVIPTQGQGQRLAGCLDSISRQILSPASFEILIVSAEDKTKIETIVSAYPHFPMTVDILPMDGANELRNFGWQNARGKWVLFLDDDCRLRLPDHLAKRVALHEKFGENTVLCGEYQDDLACTFWGRAYNEVTRLWLRRGFEENGKSRNFLGGNFSLKSGPHPLLDPTLTSGGEEIQLANNLRRLGWDIRLMDELAVGHEAHHNFTRFISRAQSHARSKPRLEESND